MDSLYRIGFLVLSVIALWSMLIIGFAVDDSFSSEYVTPESITVETPVLGRGGDETNQLPAALPQTVIIQDVPKPEATHESDPEDIDLVRIEETIAVVPTEVPEELDTTGSTIGNKLVLPVPFTSQAPEGSWSEPWQEACEEASLVMAAHYFYGTRNGIPTNIAVDEIYTLVEYQTEQGLNYHDSTMSQTADMAEDVYGLRTEVIDNPTVEQMIAALSSGYPIIVPYAGRLLGNTHFTPPGPRYHVHIIIGYDAATGEFISNDPGTRFGAQYRYTYDTVLYAMHDWTGNAATITEGAKRILVVKGFANAGTTN